MMMIILMLIAQSENSPLLVIGRDWISDVGLELCQPHEVFISLIYIFTIILAISHLMLSLTKWKKANSCQARLLPGPVGLLWQIILIVISQSIRDILIYASWAFRYDYLLLWYWSLPEARYKARAQKQFPLYSCSPIMVVMLLAYKAIICFTLFLDADLQCGRELPQSFGHVTMVKPTSRIWLHARQILLISAANESLIYSVTGDWRFDIDARRYNFSAWKTLPALRVFPPIRIKGDNQQGRIYINEFDFPASKSIICFSPSDVL